MGLSQEKQDVCSPYLQTSKQNALVCSFYVMHAQDLLSREVGIPCPPETPPSQCIVIALLYNFPAMHRTVAACIQTIFGNDPVKLCLKLKEK